MRRKRNGGLVLLAALVALGGSVLVRSHTVADDQQAIGVIVSGQMSARTGDECIVGRKSSPPAGSTMPHQVIIEDATGTIVAKRDLMSLPLDGQTPTDKVETCIATLTIDVPNSPFYRVYVDDMLLSVVDASELPLDMNTDQISPEVPWVDFGR